MDIFSKLLLIPYLLSLVYLSQPYLLASSLLFLLILLNIYFLGRSRWGILSKPVWVLPLAFSITYILSIFLPGLIGLGVFYPSLAVLLLLLFGNELGEVPESGWLYMISLFVVFGLVSYLGLGSYMFYVVTPLIDYLWFEGVSSMELIDIPLSLAPIILVYLVVAPLFIVYVLAVNLVRGFLSRVPRYYLFLSDQYLRIVVGWFLGLGY